MLILSHSQRFTRNRNENFSQQKTKFPLKAFFFSRHSSSFCHLFKIGFLHHQADLNLEHCSLIIYQISYVINSKLLRWNKLRINVPFSCDITSQKDYLFLDMAIFQTPWMLVEKLKWQTINSVD